MNIKRALSLSLGASCAVWAAVLAAPEVCFASYAAYLTTHAAILLAALPVGIVAIRREVRDER